MRSLLLVFLIACGGGKSAPAPGPAPQQPPTQQAGCAKAGCSSTICADAGSASDIVTTCEMKPEYACYQSATCERQQDGACGWTQTAELTACLANPPPM